VQKLAVSHHLAGALYKHLQNIVPGCGESHFFSVLAHAAVREIHRDVAEGEAMKPEPR
jgi:hypothetical protein